MYLNISSPPGLIRMSVCALFLVLALPWTVRAEVGEQDGLPAPGATDTASDESPSGMVAFFMQSACPSGWVVADYATGRLLVGITDTEKYDLQKTVGDEMKDATAPAHDHEYQTTVKLPSKKISAAGGANSQGGKKGTYDVPDSPPGTTETSNGQLPYIQLTVCEKQ